MHHPIAQRRRLATYVRALLHGCVLYTVLLLSSARADAQWDRYHLRETVGIGVMTSTTQVDQYTFDKPALLGSVQLDRTMQPWLELHVAVGAGAFFASRGSTGGLFEGTGGALLRVPSKRLSPYVSADLGPAWTGSFVQLYYGVTLGFDVPWGSQWFGPVFGYGQVVHANGPGESTDARFLWWGLSLRQQLAKTPEPPKPLPPKRVEVAKMEPPAPPPTEPSPDVTALIEKALPTMTRREEMLAPVLFAYDSDQLDANAVAMLHEVKRALDARPEVRRLQIEAYADQRGKVAYNLALSRRRGERVKAWLVAHGIDAARLDVVARGSEELVEPGHEDSAHEQNRRVIFRVVEQEVAR